MIRTKLHKIKRDSTYVLLWLDKTGLRPSNLPPDFDFWIIHVISQKSKTVDLLGVFIIVLAFFKGLYEFKPLISIRLSRICLTLKNFEVYKDSDLLAKTNGLSWALRWIERRLNLTRIKGDGDCNDACSGDWNLYFLTTFFWIFDLYKRFVKLKVFWTRRAAAPRRSGLEMEIPLVGMPKNCQNSSQNDGR